MKKTVNLIVALLCIVPSAFAAGFNFENVAGFETRNASSSVEGDEFVVVPLDGKIAILITEQSFADFELTLQYQAEGSASAFVRGYELPKTPIPQDTAANAPEREIHGYAVPLNGSSAGAIQDRPVRGEIASASATTKDGWNTLNINARGNSISVRINGEDSAQTEDYAYTSGKVGFLIESGAFRIRNAKMTDLGRSGDWKPLFNGENLDGWVTWGTETWTVTDGIIEGTSGPDKSEGYLATEQEWSNFHVRGSFKILGEGNYGLFYHSTIAYNDENYPIISGVQTEVAPETTRASGYLYESYKRGWLVEPDKSNPAGFAQDDSGWNEIEVLAKDNRIISWVNGVQIVDFTDDTPNYTKGAFALQLHAGGVDGILWKDLFVREVE